MSGFRSWGNIDLSLSYIKIILNGLGNKVGAAI